MNEPKISKLIDDLAKKKAEQEQLENEISDLQRMVPSFRVSAVGFPVICVGPARRDQLWGVGG